MSSDSEFRLALAWAGYNERTAREEEARIFREMDEGGEAMTDLIKRQMRDDDDSAPPRR